MPKAKTEKALLIQRVVAYLIDVMIIAMVSTLIATPFYDNDSMEKLNKTNNELVEKYMKKEINSKTYISESIDLSYEISRKNGIISLLTIFLGVIYFVCFQLYTKGQTLGKKIMKIRIIDNDKKELGVNQIIFRSLIIDSILVDILVMILVIFGNKNVSFYGTMTLNFVQYIIIFVATIMVIVTKDGRGLHDVICNTRVIKDKK